MNNRINWKNREKLYRCSALLGTHCGASGKVLAPTVELIINL
jgi:hypothetical protein